MPVAPQWFRRPWQVLCPTITTVCYAMLSITVCVSLAFWSSCFCDSACISCCWPANSPLNRSICACISLSCAHAFNHWLLIDTCRWVLPHAIATCLELMLAFERLGSLGSAPHCPMIGPLALQALFELVDSLLHRCDIRVLFTQQHEGSLLCLECLGHLVLRRPISSACQFKCNRLLLVSLCRVLLLRPWLAYWLAFRR
jgi:hypothetical protein